jgi:hypothetical protein
MLNEILEKVGLKYEDLKKEERETLNNWVKSLQQNALSVDKVKEYIGAMRDTVEQELTQVGHNSKEDIFLKARLRNYMLLEAFLSTPEKAKQALDRALAGLISNVTK